MTIRDTLAEKPKLLETLTAAQTALGEATATVKALKDALQDLEDQLMADVLDDPAAKNEQARKVRLAQLLRQSEPYQATRTQLDTALRAERMARAQHDDAERALAAWGKALAALGYQAQEEAARLGLEGYTRFAEGAARIQQAREVAASGR